MRPDQSSSARTGAENVLLGLKAAGVDYLFANAGTDFPSIIEALAERGPGEVPVPVTVPHESVGIAMAHGHWLVTSRVQAVMVHVNVGLANAAMGVINAASDNVPIVVMSGRTPITEAGREGSRATPIQYGQEMFDQSSIVRDAVKWTYEMRYPEQGAALAARAVALACSEPCAPVYLSLPREPLAEAVPEHAPSECGPRPAATPARPDQVALETAAEWIGRAEQPVILCQRGDTGGRLGPALSALAARYGIGVAEPFSIRNVLASEDLALLGYDAKAALRGADVVVVLDAGVPWIERFHAPGRDVRLIHVGPDPHFARMPVRGFRTDLAITSDAVAFVEALSMTLPEPGEKHAARMEALAERARARVEAARAKARDGSGEPISAEWLSACVAEVLGESGIAFSELGLLPGMMNLRGQNRLFSNVHAGGLGWAMPAALGAQLANRDRLVVAAMGDGSYIFANPVACHQVAEAQELPILTVVKNNAMWNAVRRSVVNSYPEGAAARANEMPLTSLEPLPDFCTVASASRAHVARVTRGADLPGALAEAVRVIREDRRQALVDVRVAAGDTF